MYGVATHNGRTVKGKESEIESYMDKVDEGIGATRNETDSQQ